MVAHGGCVIMVKGLKHSRFIYVHRFLLSPQNNVLHSIATVSSVLHSIATDTSLAKQVFGSMAAVHQGTTAEHRISGLGPCDITEWVCATYRSKYSTPGPECRVCGYALRSPIQSRWQPWSRQVVKPWFKSLGPLNEGMEPLFLLHLKVSHRFNNWARHL